MTSKDIKTVELIVNSDQAKGKLKELNMKLNTMKQKRNDVLNRGDSHTRVSGLVCASVL